MPTAQEQITKIKDADADQLQAILDEENQHEGGPRKSVTEAAERRSKELSENAPSAGTDDPADDPEDPGEHDDSDADSDDEDIEELPSDDDEEPEAGDSAQIAQYEALLDKKPDLEEPFEGYNALSEDAIVDELNNYGVSDLAKILAYETAVRNRDKIKDEIKERLEGYEASIQESHFGQSPQDLITEATKFGAALDVDDVDVDDILDSGVKPYAEGSLQEKAGLSSNNPEVDDPARFFPNARYVQERDNTRAAMFQESATSAAPDDMNHRMAAANAASEGLRRESEAARRNMSESNIYERALEAAENGEPWPPQEDPDEIRAERDRGFEKDRDEVEGEAKKVAQQLFGSEVPEAREGAPAPPGSLVVTHEGDLALATSRHAPFDESVPASAAYQPFSAVSRRDEHHGKLGVVLRPDDLPMTGLVKVAFPDGDVWMNIVNLRYEGDARALLRQKDAAVA